MAEQQVPYVTGYGNITKALKKIQSAATPDRFTQDFLATKLGLKGGSPRPVIPFLKRTGFLNSDGTPTALYKRFRNPSQRGAAAAEALRRGYARLYESNEYAHELTGQELRGLVIQATGLDETSSTFKAVIGSFNALKAFADFAAEEQEEESPEEEEAEDEMRDEGGGEGRIERLPAGVNLGAAMAPHYEVFYSLETSIRTLVAESLRAEDGEDWWNGGRIPEGIKNAAEANRQREIESGMTPRSDDLLDFTTFGELSQIIEANWDVFGASLVSVRAVKRVMGNLNTLRGPNRALQPAGRGRGGSLAAKRARLVPAHGVAIGARRKFDPRPARLRF